MGRNGPRRVALVWHGDREARDKPGFEGNRLEPTANALRAVGLEPEPAVYNDDFADEVNDQLLGVDGVLVWVNPIEQGRDRTRLDALLTDVARSGVFVSAHPRTIQKMGTKDVLTKTRAMSWGSDVHRFSTLTELQSQLPARVREGRPRVLKQLRGHSGNGVWQVSPHPSDPGQVLARHAARGSIERALPWAELFAIFEEYFSGQGHMIDQAYQERLAEGMVRLYMVGDGVAGFGHQEVNALFPAPPGAAPEDTPQPGQRLYYPLDTPAFQPQRTKMESEWMPELLRTLDMDADELPLLWDADLLYGPKTATGEDTFVLCEINVSSVYPYPESAIEPLALATLDRLSR